MELLKSVIVKYGKGLNSRSEDAREAYANLLLFIYNRHKTALLQKQIASFNGRLILKKIPHEDITTSYYTCDDEYDYDHTDRPGRPERRFSVPE